MPGAVSPVSRMLRSMMRPQMARMVPLAIGSRMSTLSRQRGASTSSQSCGASARGHDPVVVGDDRRRAVDRIVEVSRPDAVGSDPRRPRPDGTARAASPGRRGRRWSSARRTRRRPAGSPARTAAGRGSPASPCRASGRRCPAARPRRRCSSRVSWSRPWGEYDDDRDPAVVVARDERRAPTRP